MLIGITDDLKINGPIKYKNRESEKLTERRQLEASTQPQDDSTVEFMATGLTMRWVCMNM